jgi:methyl-accepting chemotaxis protein
MMMFKDTHRNSLSTKLNLIFFAVLTVTEGVLIAVSNFFEVRSVVLWIVLVLLVSLISTLVFHGVVLNHIRQIRELLKAVSALGRGDLTVRISWATPLQEQNSTELTVKINQLSREFESNFTGKFSLERQRLVKVDQINVPALRCGQTALNLDTNAVDQFSGSNGSVATIFAKRGEDLVRVSTSLKKPDGSRVVGTMLDNSSIAYSKLQRGESFVGTAQLFGKIYMTHYSPIIDEQRQTIGALFVGMELNQNNLNGDEVNKLGQAINTVSVGFSDFVAGLSKSAESVANAATELSVSTERVADSSRQLSEATATTAAAVEQVTVSISHVADHASSTEKASIQTKNLSEGGEKVVQEASSEIARISDSLKELSQVITFLGEHSTEISGIVQVIKDIADRTNLLALNAAIEAARAGEQGRGFAVVADEVRKLAESTGVATLKITGIIDSTKRQVDTAIVNMSNSQTQVQSGVVLTDQARDSLKKISSETRRTVEMVKEISEATKEQSDASNEIARNVETIAQKSEENSLVIEKLANSATHLEQMSSNLQNMANRFRL